MKISDFIFCAGIAFASISQIAFANNQNDSHQHQVNQLQLRAVKIVEVKNGRLTFIDLEENAANDLSNEMIVQLHSIEVDKSFRFLNLQEDKRGEIKGKLLGLGALEGSIGILTSCSGCGRALAMKIGKVNLFK